MVARSRRVAASARVVDVTWRPFQDDLRGEPFWMLAACVLVNRTRWRGSAEVALAAIRRRWPTPEELAEADPDDVGQVIRTLGLHRARSRNLVRMAAAWRDGERDPARLPGCGPYAADSHAIFVEGRRDVEPTDRALRAYLTGTPP
jgi:endonuclease III